MMARYREAICRVYVSYMLAICKLYVGYMLCICKLYVKYMWGRLRIKRQLTNLGGI